jgi:hypothetical protein
MEAGETRMVDWRGQEIKVGDVVVYPVRQSSSVWMVEGEVVELHSLIEDRWKNRDEGQVPTQVGGVTVIRKRASGWRGDDIKPDHKVKVGLDRLTVVIPAEVMEFARYPVRYMIGPEDPAEVADEFNIEVDGRAT